MRSTKTSITMMVPVRPMPALWGPTPGRSVASLREEAVACSGLHLPCPPTLSPVAPAVHHHGSSPRHAALGPVHLIQEAEDARGLGGDPVVWPAEVLVVLHCAPRLFLGGEGG